MPKDDDTALSELETMDVHRLETQWLRDLAADHEFRGGQMVLIVCMAFRNGPLENLHAGKRSRLLDDATLSRITNAEMKVLMIAACEQMERLLRWKATDPEEYRSQIMFFSKFYCYKWDR